MKKLFFISMAATTLFCGCQSNIEDEAQLYSSDAEVAFAASEGTAVERALNFVNGFGRTTRGASDISTSDVASVYPWLSKDICHDTRAEGDADLPDTLLYIVNFADNGGYVLVSAEEEKNLVFAYVQNGNLSPDDDIENPGLRYYLDRLVSYIPSVPDTANIDPPKPWNPGGELGAADEPGSIEELYQPILSTRWGQRAPFNTYCFTPAGTQSVAGCVAIALAQIFSAHQKPASYNGHDYLWNEMLTGNVPTSDAGKESAARLASDIGGLVQMEYKDNSAGAYMDYVPCCFQAFNYSFAFSTYNYSLVLDNIKSENPVYIFGSSKGGKSAHAWVIDGVLIWNSGFPMLRPDGETDKVLRNYVHCNWGWYGLDDGYYLSGVFDLNKQYFDDEGERIGDKDTDDIDLSYANKIFYNIQPKTNSKSY